MTAAEQRLRELLTKVSKAPWIAHESSDGWWIEPLAMGDYGDAMLAPEHGADARFMAACREDVPVLLDELARLRVEQVLKCDDNLKVALQPFADFATAVDGNETSQGLGDNCGLVVEPLCLGGPITLGDCRGARSALDAITASQSAPVSCLTGDQQ